MDYYLDSLSSIVEKSAFSTITYKNGIMILVAYIFLFLAIKKDYEPLLLIPIFGK